MINSIELEIIKKYVTKSKQERIIWELDNPKKRENIVLTRFANPSIFNKKCLHQVEYMSPAIMKNYLFRLGKSKEVYFVGEKHIGELSLEQASRRANTGEICIIYCGNGVGYYQGEQEYGKPPRFLLLSKEL